MTFIRNALVGFLVAFVTILALMLLSHWLGWAPFEPRVATGIAAGIGLAQGARAHFKPSPVANAVLMGVLVGAGSLIGHWLTTHG